MKLFMLGALIGAGLLLGASPGLVPAANANPVHVDADGNVGRGLAGMRGNECLVILPAHVLGNRQQARVTGTGGASAAARFLKSVGESSDDLAILRVEDGGEAVCSNADQAILKSLPGVVMVSRSASGGLAFEPMRLSRKQERILVLDFPALDTGSDASDRKRISGSLILENGTPAGIVLQLLNRAERGADMVASNLNYIASLEGGWVRGPARDVSQIAQSLTLLTRLVEMRPKGDMGQIAAIEDLVRNGSPLSGVDLRGLGLEGAVLSQSDLSEARLTGSNLRNALLARADLNATFFDFADLAGSDFSATSASKARFYFAQADGATFEGINGVSSNWAGVSARGANFRGADLRSANFLLADLRNADFTNADLRGAFFPATNLEGATFTGARFDRTDFSSALGEINSFDGDQQAAMCASQQPRSGVLVTLMRVVPSSQFRSGKDFDELVQSPVYLPSGIDALPTCDLGREPPVGLSPFWDWEGTGSGTFITERLRLDYASDPFDKIGVQRDFRARVNDQLDMYWEAAKTTPILQLSHLRGEEITGLLQDRIGTLRLHGLPEITDHTTRTALHAHFEPDFFPEDFWGIFAEDWIEYEQRVRQDPVQTPKIWPEFFGEGVFANELSDTHAMLFREWSAARGRALLDRNVSVRIGRPKSQIVKFTFGQAEPDLKTMSLTLADVLPDHVLASGRPDVISAQSGFNIMLRLSHNADDLMLEFKNLSYAELRGASQMRLIGRVTGFASVDKNARNLNDHVSTVDFDARNVELTLPNGTTQRIRLIAR